MWEIIKKKIKNIKKEKSRSISSQGKGNKMDVGTPFLLDWQKKMWGLFVEILTCTWGEDELTRK